MTSRSDRERILPIRFATIIRASITLGLLSGSFALTGCKKKAPPPPPPPRVTNTGPIVPEWQTVADPMSLSPKLDVSGAEYKECDETQMRTAFQFVNAFAAGDDQTLRTMLDPQMASVLDDLLLTDEWQETTGSISKVELTRCEGVSRDEVKVDFVVTAGDDSTPDVQHWVGKARGDLILFSASYELGKMELPTNNLAEGDGEGDDGKKGASSGGKGKGRDPGNPKDPRRRVPKQAPDPGPGKGPRGPG